MITIPKNQYYTFLMEHNRLKQTSRQLQQIRRIFNIPKGKHAVQYLSQWRRDVLTRQVS